MGSRSLTADAGGDAGAPVVRRAGLGLDPPQGGRRVRAGGRRRKNVPLNRAVRSSTVTQLGGGVASRADVSRPSMSQKISKTSLHQGDERLPFPPCSTKKEQDALELCKFSKLCEEQRAKALLVCESKDLKEKFKVPESLIRNLQNRWFKWRSKFF